MFKILKDYCTPKRGTKYSAYVDLFSAEDVTIGAGETKVIKLGVKLDLDLLKENMTKYSMLSSIKSNEIFDLLCKRHYLEVALRSSLAVKGLIIANGIGIIDLDYPDEIGLIVHNPVNINKGFYTTGEHSTDLHIRTDFKDKTSFNISKGDKVAQCTLKEHKGYLMGYETETLRTGGFGSTDNKELLNTDG